MSTKSVNQLITTRDGYGDALLELGEKNPNIVALTADLSDSTKSIKFEKKFPNRFFQVGVAEQNMAGIAAGLALSGKIPFMASYSVFSPGRNWDQIRVSICYSNANVKIIGSHTGLSAAPDGATHEALEDIALMRVLPNMTVLYPCDYFEAKKAVIEAAKHKGPVYIRFSREKSPLLTHADAVFKIGKANVMEKGTDLTVISCGPILANVLEAAKNVKKATSTQVEVINCASIKPLDTETLLASGKKTGKVLVVEEHQIAGGLGGAVCELFSEKHPMYVKRLGMKDSFGESGTYEELLNKYGLSVLAIEKEILRIIE